MAKTHELGNKGEALALSFLESKGLIVLERNWRFSRAEVDIIAKDGDILVFVEVKTRKPNQLLPPEAAVTRKKRELLIEAAGAYMEEIQHDWEIRFDIIAIQFWSDQRYEITHHQDAFFPEW